ncbi:MAG: cupredoxin domain-containing protein [Pseudonocardiaceae bacterium]
MMMAYHRHRVATALAAVLTMVSVALVVTACRSSAATTAPVTPAALVNPVSAITVVINHFAFLPARFTVAPGATVTVVNKDAAIHTLTADNMDFNTGNLAQDQPATFQAPTQPGKYPYHSLRQPYMTGVLTVS